jgi:hypothetical protein
MATKKKTKPQTVDTDEYVDTVGSEVDEVVSQYDLSKSQKITLTRENFTLLKNFVTGKFPESYGDPWERLKITPEKCPHCRFAGGWDYCGGATMGATHAGFGKEYFRQNRVVSVRCLSCGGVYRVTESWLIYFEVAEQAAVGQT